MFYVSGYFVCQHQSSRFLPLHFHFLCVLFSFLLFPPPYFRLSFKGLFSSSLFCGFIFSFVTFVFAPCLLRVYFCFLFFFFYFIQFFPCLSPFLPFVYNLYLSFSLLSRSFLLSYPSDTSCHCQCHLTSYSPVYRNFSYLLSNLKRLSVYLSFQKKSLSP